MDAKRSVLCAMNADIGCIGGKMRKGIGMVSPIIALVALVRRIKGMIEVYRIVHPAEILYIRSAKWLVT